MLSIVENMLLFLMLLMSLSVSVVSNPIQSLLWLILVFGLSSIIFMMLGVEFLALLIFMVYIGAMAVLFLFVIMMLNMKVVELRSLYFNYLPMSLFMMMIFFFEIFFSFFSSYNNFFFDYNYFFWLKIFDYNGNMYLFGYIMYTYYSFFIMIMSLMLLVSMLGSIVLVTNWNLNNKYSYYNNIYYFSFKSKLLVSSLK